MTPSFTLGVLGGGRHAQQSHIQPLLHMGHSITVWDPSPTVQETLATMDGVTVVSTEEDVWSTADGVVVCSPDQYHTPALLEAARRDMPILVEKPIATTMEEARSIRSILLESSLIVSTCHPRRTDPPFQALKAAWNDLVEEYGDVKQFNFHFTYPPPRPDQPQIHASLLIDHFGHEFDLMEYFLGSPFITSGRDTLANGLDPQLYYSVEGDRSDRVSYRFTGQRTDPNQTIYEETLTIVYPNATLTLNNDAGEAVIISPTGTRHLPVGGTDYLARFQAVNKNFIDVINRGAEPYVEKKQIWRNTSSAAQLVQRDVFSI